MVNRYTIILIFILFGMPLLSQRYYLSHYTEESGLDNAVVNAIYKDSQDQMWIGTDGGLFLFNGRTFSQIKRGIPSKYIRDIKSIGDNSIVISHDAGISVARTLFNALEIDETYNDISTEQKIKYPNRLFVDNKSNIWISQPDGSLGYHDGQNYQEVIASIPNPKNTKFHYSFIALDENKILISSSAGNIYMHHGGSGEIKEIGKFFPIEDLLFYNDKIILAGEKLAITTWDEQRETLSVDWQSSKEDSYFTALAKDDEGKVYVGTEQDGLFNLSLTADPVLKEVFSNNDPHRVDRLPFKKINTILVTQDNAIWIGAEEGLGLLQERFFSGVKDLPNDKATTFALADNGDVYVAMGDVFRIEKKGVDFSARKLSLPNVGTFNGLAVSDQELWSGTNNGYLVKMDLNGKLLKNYSFSERGAGIFNIFADHSGRKWFCQAPKGKPLLGVAMIDSRGKVKMYGKDKGIDNRMLVVKESPRKEIYAAGIGKKSYLYKYIPADDKFINMSLPFNFPVSPNFEVHDIAIDDRGLVWMATTDGLLRHDMENVIRPDLGVKFTGKEIRAVEVLSDSSLWISTDIYGMLRYKNGEVLEFGEDSGLPTKIMAYRGILIDNDDKLWINTSEGVTHSSQDLPHPLKTPTPILYSISYQEEELQAKDGTYAITTGGKLEVNFNTYAYPGDLTTYQYRVSGLSQGKWENLYNQSSLSLEIMDKDIQEIAIRARKTGGYDWSEPMRVALDVSLPWHLRRSSQIGLGLLLATLFFILWKANSRKYKNRIVKLESDLDDKEYQLTKEKQDKDQGKGIEVREVLEVPPLEFVYEVTENTEVGMKWDRIIEHLSMAILKLSNVPAFEIGVLDKRSNRILIDGYTQIRDEFYQREKEWSKADYIYINAIKSQKLSCIDREVKENDPMYKWTGPCTTVLSVPIIFSDSRIAVLCLYGSNSLKNKNLIMAVKSVANHLELLT